jgi:hypothetical protein
MNEAILLLVGPPRLRPGEESDWIPNNRRHSWWWWRLQRKSCYFDTPAEACAKAERRRPSLKERVTAIAASTKKAQHSRALLVALWQPVEAWPRPLPGPVLHQIVRLLDATDS